MTSKYFHSLKKPFIIAEIGVNHECSVKRAKRLILLAKKGGADAVKFQTYKAEKLASKHSPAYWDKKEEKTKKSKTEKEILMMDISELTKAYYGVLKRNKELSEENQKLKQQLDSNPLHGPEYRQRYHT